MKVLEAIKAGSKLLKEKKIKRDLATEEAKLELVIDQNELEHIIFLKVE